MSTPRSRKGFPSSVNWGMDSPERMSALDAIVSPEELQDLVDRFGEDLTNWPRDLREPAEELIDECAEARAIIIQARRLRDQLRKLGTKAPSCIVDRIVSVALDIDPPVDDPLRLKN